MQHAQLRKYFLVVVFLLCDTRTGLLSTAWGNNPCKHRVGTTVDSHRGAGTRRRLCACSMFREGVTTRKNGSHSVVLYHSLEYPKADHVINRRVVGRAKCLRVARRPLSPAERKKERQKEREIEAHRGSSHSVSMLCVTSFLPVG